MDEFLILLQAKLDEAKSKGNINSDIDKIQSQIDHLKVQVEIDPKTVSNLVKQIEDVLNQKINISNIKIDQSQTNKATQQLGEKIGNSIAQNVSNGVSKATNSLKSFSKLKIGTGNISAVLDKNGLVDIEQTLNRIRQTYSEFGQVRITNKIFDFGELQQFQVNIQQVNGDLKETRSFMMSLASDGKSFTFPNDIIKGSENVVHHLNEAKNATIQIATEADKLAAKVGKIQLSIGSNGNTTTQIEVLRNNFTKLGLSADEVKTKMGGIDTEVQQLKSLMSSGADNSAIVSQFERLQTVLTQAQNNLKATRSEYGLLVTAQQRLAKANEIEAWNQKNTAATKSVINSNRAYITSLRDLNSQMTKMQFNEIVNGFKQSEISMRGLGKLGASIKSQFAQAAQSFGQWLSVSSGIMLLISKTRSAISELKNLDNILTEISKTSDLTTQELKELGLSSYDSASTYGRTASDYLTGVQEMSRSGFYGEKAEGMAKQSLLAQSAGDMDAELANKYVLATNAAYKLNGEEEKLNEILDGQNQVTNTNSVAMADMATAMTEAGTVASSYRVSIEDLTAMIGTIESVTKLGGSEVGNAIKAILINLQNVTSDKIVTTLDKANASMTEMINGTKKLRNPIDILRDLAETFNELDEDDPLRAEILTNIGQKYHAQKLGALLQNMDMYDKMLVDYSEGSGSAMEESNKSANNLEGTINKLSNSWTEFVNTLINSNELKTVVNWFNVLVQGATDLTNAISPLGTIGLGAGLVASVKNIGITYECM